MKFCTFPGCANPMNARGLCMGHSYQAKAGKELTPLRPRRKVIDGKKECASCGRTFPVEHFGMNGSSVFHRCKECQSIYARAYRYKLDPETVRRLVAQETCDVCGGEAVGRFQHIDHDHATGKVRGVLCHSCNVILGHVSDDPSLLRALAAYLERS